MTALACDENPLKHIFWLNTKYVEKISRKLTNALHAGFFFFPSVSLSLFIVFLLIPSCKDIGESETK